MELEMIRSMIYEVRGVRVMLDFLQRVGEENAEHIGEMSKKD